MSVGFLKTMRSTLRFETSRRLRALSETMDRHTREILSGASIALFFQVAGAGTNFLFCVVLTRTLGAEASGTFFLALTVVTVVGMLGRSGLENSLLRFTASSVSLSDWAGLKGVYTQGIGMALAVGTLLSGLLFFIAPWIAEHLFSNSALAPLLRRMSLAVLPLTLYTLYSFLLRGVKRIAESVSVFNLMVPLFALLSFQLLAKPPSAGAAVEAYTLGATLTTGIGLWFWHRRTPQLGAVRGRFPFHRLLRSCMPLLWMSVMQLMLQWSTVLMIGVWRPSSEVAIFSIALRTANLISFMLYATNSIVAAKFAALHKLGDREGLKHTARTSTLLMTCAAIPLTGLFLAFPSPILHLFGSDFDQGGPVFMILTVGNFINVATGSVSFLLMMCGYEGWMANITACSALLNVGLNAALIPTFGMVGGAIAASSTGIVLNLLAVAAAWYKLEILMLPWFPRLRGWTRNTLRLPPRLERKLH